MFEPCDVMERLGHFDGIVPSPVRILTLTWHLWWKIPLENT